MQTYPSDAEITSKLESMFGVPVFIGFGPEGELAEQENYNYFVINTRRLRNNGAGRYVQMVDISRVYDGATDLREEEIISALKSISMFEAAKDIVEYGIARKGQTDSYIDIAVYHMGRGTDMACDDYY